MVNLANYKTQIEEAKENTGTSSKVPSGDYVVICTSTEDKENSKKNGHFIINEYEIQEGEHAGEKLIDRINYDNPNDVARNIAFATLKSLGKAIGIEPLADTQQLIGKRIIAKVKNEEGNQPVNDDNGNQKTDDNGKPIFYRNVNITKYMPYAASQTSAPKPTGGSFPFPSK